MHSTMVIPEIKKTRGESILALKTRYCRIEESKSRYEPNKFPKVIMSQIN